MGKKYKPKHEDEAEQDKAPPVYSNRAIGLALKALRESRGMASLDMAEEAEIHPSYYSMLENGRNCISVKKLSQICGVSQVRLSDFFGRLEREGEGEAPTADENAADTAEKKGD